MLIFENSKTQTNVLLNMSFLVLTIFVGFIAFFYCVILRIDSHFFLKSFEGVLEVVRKRGCPLFVHFYCVFWPNFCEGSWGVNLCHSMKSLPLGSFGTKLMVLVLARRFSPVPSIQMYMHWTLFEGTPSFMYLKWWRKICCCV